MFFKALLLCCLAVAAIAIQVQDVENSYYYGPGYGKNGTEVYIILFSDLEIVCAEKYKTGFPYGYFKSGVYGGDVKPVYGK